MTAMSGQDEDFDWTWAGDEVEWLPPAVDLSRPSAARIQDYALGGKDNFAVDRGAVHQLLEVVPDWRRLARAGRDFLDRAIRIMAGQGVRQFLDLGAGIPTSPSTHEIARAVVPGARVVYVDLDPVVVVHTRALIATEPGTGTVREDLCVPAAVLGHPQALRLIDPGEPVGVLMCGVLHFVDHHLAPGIVAQYRRMVPAGSHIAISVLGTGEAQPWVLRRMEAVYSATRTPLYCRSRGQVEQFFDQLELLEPGVTDANLWRADAAVGEVPMLCGVGRKP